MKEIPLTRGKVAIVDDADFEWLSRFEWHAEKRGYGRGYWYAVTKIKGVHIEMHRLLMGSPGKQNCGKLVDHEDGDTLRNVRSNLRWATRQHNSANSRNRSAPGFRGVTERAGKYRAPICLLPGKRKMATFDTPEIAARARDKAAVEAYGRFAQLNYPQDVAA